MNTEQNLPEAPTEGLTVENPLAKPNVPKFADAIFVFCLFLAISFMAGSLAQLFSKGAMPKTPETSQALFYAKCISHIIGILLPVLIYIRLRKFNLKETLNLNPVPALTLLWITFVSIGVFVGIGYLQTQLEPIFRPFQGDMEEYQNFYKTIARSSRSRIDILFLVATIGLIPAVIEEILFRGIMLSGFRNSSTPAKAVLLAGLLFGIIHFFPPQMIAISLLGIYFGFLAVKTRSIVTAIWCHFLNNFLMIMAMFIVQ